ncbi:phosphoribosyl-ATP pyrophosphohydrolase [Ammoniphilus sp. 3BR4]|uniref:phosphoribosyl-ATP pyrophosphohydrolase n=1 Tax=Ammoniphilus sp. 3BR4 TaxID=3158265 RepID=UPI003465E386
MPVYKKLVRDRIPEIIEATGKKYTTRILEEQEYKTELQKKMREELAEYLSATSDKDSLEELADLLEVIHALTAVHESTPNQLEVIRMEKAEKRGGFQERLFLIDVEEDEI